MLTVLVHLTVVDKLRQVCDQCREMDMPCETLWGRSESSSTVTCWSCLKDGKSCSLGDKAKAKYSKLEDRGLGSSKKSLSERIDCRKARNEAVESSKKVEVLGLAQRIGRRLGRRQHKKADRKSSGSTTKVYSQNIVKFFTDL